MPQGVHVAHAIIDGVIDIPRTKEWLKDAGADAKISPDAVSAYWPGLLAVLILNERRLLMLIGICTLSQDQL